MLKSYILYLAIKNISSYMGYGSWESEFVVWERILPF